MGELIKRRGCRCVRLCYNQIGCHEVTAIADSVSDSKCIIDSLQLCGYEAGDRGEASAGAEQICLRARRAYIGYRSAGGLDDQTGDRSERCAGGSGIVWRAGEG